MKNNINKFLKQNGFLLILFIGVCVVAVGTLRIATVNLKTSDDVKNEDLVILDEIIEDPEDGLEENVEVSLLDDPKENHEDVIVEALEEEEEVTEVEEPLEEEFVVEEEAGLDAEMVVNEEELEYIDDYEEEEVQIVTSKSLEFELPVQGEIISELSMDKLVYSKTLDEWRVHNGIDIKANAGTKVKSPLDGTIKSVFEDDLWGITIIIDHGDGLETKLSNLGTMEMVKSGVSVKKGDYISTVGKSATVEMLMDEHIHFEATKNGKIIDPRSITK